MYSNNELLFPPGIIRYLKRDRTEPWNKLIEQVMHLPEDEPDSLAFSLLMIRLNGCLNCETDSYRAMRGCRDCSQQSLRRFKGPDDMLLHQYQNCLTEVSLYISQHQYLQPPKKTFAPRAA